MSATDKYLVHAEHGEYSDWCYDPLGIFDTEEDGTYSYDGIGRYGSSCTVFVTKFEGGTGIIPSWIEVDG